MAGEYSEKSRRDIIHLSFLSRVLLHRYKSAIVTFARVYSGQTPNDGNYQNVTPVNSNRLFQVIAEGPSYTLAKNYLFGAGFNRKIKRGSSRRIIAERLFFRWYNVHARCRRASRRDFGSLRYCGKGTTAFHVCYVRRCVCVRGCVLLNRPSG